VAGTATTLPGAARGRAAALRRLPPAALPVAIVGLAAGLRLIALGRVTPNPVYDAAVRTSAVRSGRLRYALLGATCTPSSGDRLTGCSPAARWIRAHGVDVSRQAGQPHPGLLYRLRA
jgi:hypothetical protein